MTPSPVLNWQPISRKAYRRQRMKEWGIAIGLALVVTIIGFAANAEARPRHHRHHGHHAHHHHRHHRHHHHRSHPIDANGISARQVIGHRPADCPHAWCGCGLARYLGLNDRRLWLARAWRTLFPHTDGHSGAVGIAPSGHHVLLVERHIEGTKYLVRDFNGGKGLAWLHVRDLRGFVFVEPNRRSAAI